MPWKIASSDTRDRTRRVSPATTPFASGCGGMTKYSILLHLSLSSSCGATDSPSSCFSDSPKTAPAPSGTMSPSIRLRLLRSNWSSRPYEAQKRKRVSNSMSRSRKKDRGCLYLGPGPECHNEKTVIFIVSRVKDGWKEQKSSHYKAYHERDPSAMGDFLQRRTPEET